MKRSKSEGQVKVNLKDKIEYPETMKDLAMVFSIVRVQDKRIADIKYKGKYYCLE